MLTKIDDTKLYDIYINYMIKDFPDDELKPYDMLIQNPKIEYYLYDDYGYVIIMKSDSYIIVDYLAVFKQYRNLGYGSKILQELFDIYQDYIILIEAETPYDSISLKRLQFYQKNGMYTFPLSVNLYYVNYTLLSNKPLNHQLIKDIYLTFYDKAFLKQYATILDL